jgi:hypothetical protein
MRTVGADGRAPFPYGGMSREAWMTSIRSVDDPTTERRERISPKHAAPEVVFTETSQ